MSICVALGELSYEECAEILRKEDLCELRLDLLALNDRLKELLSFRAKAVVTCRPAPGETKAAADARLALLVQACKLGAAYVDIELDAPPEFQQAVRAAARAHGTAVIVSHHDFERTPPAAELQRLVEQCFAKGADVAKIACTAQTFADNAALLSLLGGARRLVVVGMGEAGKLTRVAAPLLGAEFTFAAPDAKRGTAAGQLSAGELRKLYAELARAGISVPAKKI